MNNFGTKIQRPYDLSIFKSLTTFNSIGLLSWIFYSYYYHFPLTQIIKSISMICFSIKVIKSKIDTNDF